MPWVTSEPSSNALRVHHVALRTRDLTRLRSFYEGTLGLPVVRVQPHSVWLDMGGAILMLEAASEDEPRVPAGSMELLALAMAAGERGAYEARLARGGVAVEARTPFTLYFRDPDGRRVGLSHFEREKSG